MWLTSGSPPQGCRGLPLWAVWCSLGGIDASKRCRSIARAGRLQRSVEHGNRQTVRDRGCCGAFVTFRPVTITGAARSARIRPAAALWRSLTGFDRAVRPSGRRPVRLRIAPRTLSAIRVARRLRRAECETCPRSDLRTGGIGVIAVTTTGQRCRTLRSGHTSPNACAEHTDHARLSARDRTSPARWVVGQLAKPGGDQSLPAWFGGRALLKLRPIERRLPLRWPQRSVPGGALETRHPGSRRMRHRGWLPFKNPWALYRCPRSTWTVMRIVQDRR
jgi:hypothetical protein